MPSITDVLAAAGIGGAPARPGVVHVVAVPRFDQRLTSVRAALLVASAEVVRVPPQLPPDVLAPLVGDRAVAGDLESLTVDDVGAGARAGVVQLVATAMQTAPMVSTHVARLRAGGVTVEVVAGPGEVEAALVAGGVAWGVARTPTDGRLDVSVLAADAPDLAAWRSGLRDRGYLAHTPLVLVERAGTPMQRETVLKLRDLKEHEADGPVIAVVGDDVGLPVAWRDDLPLRGLTIANLRAAHQAAELSGRLRDLGAHVLEAPLLDVEQGDAPVVDAAVDRLVRGEVALLGLTSRNGVAALAAALERRQLDARVLAAVTSVACVGPGTAEELWERLRVRADVVATEQTGTGLADAVGAPVGAGSTVLLLRGQRAAADLPTALAAAGWLVEDVVAYRTVTRTLPPPVLEAFGQGAVQLVPVTSSSMARALVEQGRPRGVRAAIVSIGPVTTATLEELGVTPLVEADPHDLDGLVAALCEAATGA